MEETLWAVSEEEELGTTPTQITTGPRLPFFSPGGPWVKKRAGPMDDQLIYQALINSQILGPTVLQTPLSEVLKTPRIELTPRWACLPPGLRKGVVGQSDR